MRARVRRGRTVVTAVLLVFWFAFAFARSAGAQVPQGGSAANAAATPAHTVDVTIVAGGDAADALMGTIRELLGRLGLTVNPHVIDVPSPALEPAQPGASLSVWIDLASRYEAVAIVRDERTEVRRTIPRDGSPAIVREEIGEAVRSAVEAQLLSDATRTATPVAPPPLPTPVAAPIDADKPAPAVASNRWFALDLTILAGGALVDGSGVVPRIGGGVVIASRGRWRPSLTLTGSYVPLDATFPPTTVTMRTTFVSLRAVPAIEIVRVPRLAVEVGAGGGVDVISVDPSATDSSIVVTPRPSRVDPIVTALATAYVELAPALALTLVVGADVDFDPPEYKVDGPGGGDILSAWRVRPVALAGFTFTAIGSELFAARTP